MKKNVASQVVGAQINSKTDGSAVTSGTTTVYVTGNGGTQATGSVGSGACTHEGHGFWTYAPAQAETNYDHVAFTFENSAGVNATVQIYTSFPQTTDAASALSTLQTSVNDLPTNAELSTALGDVPTAAENADKLLGRNLAGGSDGARTVQDALRSLRNKTSIVAGTLTVTEEDDTTPAWTAVVTTAAGDPLTSIDPA